MSDILLCRCKQGTSKSKAKQSKWSEALTQHTQQFTTSLHCNFTSICNRFCVRSDILRHRSWGVRFTVISHTVPVVARIIIVPLWIFMGRPKFSETASSSPFLFPRMTWITHRPRPFSSHGMGGSSRSRARRFPPSDLSPEKVFVLHAQQRGD